MKKFILSITIMLMTTSLYATSYECWRYVNSKPQGYVKVSASSNSDAVEKAIEKFRDISKKVDYVKCK